MAKPNGVTMKNLKESFEILRSQELWLTLIDSVESTIGHHFVPQIAADPSITTVGEWAQAIEERKRQQTSALTVRFAYDFEARFRQVARQFGVDVLDKEESDVGCDFRVLTSDWGIIHFEVKTTQSVQGWTGSTHSEGKGKANNYVLVSFGLDLDYPISTSTYSLPGVIESVHCSVLGEDIPVNWNGTATTSNSSTTGKIPSSASEAYKKAIVFGSVKNNQVWCKCIREDIRYRLGKGEVAAK